MKKILYIALGCLFFGLVPHVFAQGFVPLAPIPGLTEGVTANSAGLATFFNNLYKYLIGLAAILAVIMIIWGGLEISTQDSISKQGAGREKIKNAIFGLVLVLSPVLVFSIINPSILNLSLNLPKLDTTTSNGVGVGTTAPATTVPGGNPNLSQLPPAQQAACIAYSEFRIIPTPPPTNAADCKNALGAGWVGVADVCSGTVVPPGSGVCGLTSTTQQAQTGCTTTHYSGTFETAICTTKNFASNYKCQNGLNPTIPECTTKDAQGNCVGNVSVYCGKSTTVLYYAATYHLVGALVSSAIIVPRDAQVQNDFASACSAGGGKIDISTSKGLVGNLQFANAVPGNCPIDSQVPNFTSTGGTTGQTGVTCYNRILSCQL